MSMYLENAQDHQQICCNLVTISLNSWNSFKRCPTFLQVLAAGEWLKSAESVDAVIQEAPTWPGVDAGFDSDGFLKIG